MGYLVVAHVTKSAPDPAKLSVLPKSIDWSIYQSDDARAFYLDTYAAGRQQEWPFTSMPPTKDISLELAPGLESLAVPYRVLEEAQLANAFKRGFLNMNLALSNALQMSVCSLCSDDDGLDFACVSEHGRLQRLHCECGDLDIVYEDGKVTIQPLLLEDGEPTVASRRYQGSRRIPRGGAGAAGSGRRGVGEPASQDRLFSANPADCAGHAAAEALVEALVARSRA